MWASKTLLYADIMRTRENDSYDRSLGREEIRGEILRGDRGFVEIEASWRLLRGEKRSAERRLQGEILRGETRRGM